MSELLTLDEADRLYEETQAGKDAYEQRDLCCGELDSAFVTALAAAIAADGGEPDQLWKEIAPLESAPPLQGASIPNGGKILKSIRGMGTIYDWRDSNWCQPNGGRITAHLGVQHIPVIHNVKGIADLITLGNVLIAQGLMVQQGTDSEGNVALYTPGNRLCYQARGANQVSWGTEHMHFTTSEPWSKKQLRASAWIIQLNKRHYGTPRGRASLGAGNGTVRVLRPGQTTHMRVAWQAGFKDRSDPGEGTVPNGYDFEYVDHCIVYFDKHGHFAGA